MNSWKKFKRAISNPPPERLAKIEYQSHLLQAIGIIFVCGMLIYKGFWYIIFAMIFGVGVSYSQGITAYKKYVMIKSLTQEEDPRDYEKDISFTRRRHKIINYVIGKWGQIICSILAVLFTIYSINPYWNRYILMVAYPLSILVVYLSLYLFICYWMCYPIYKTSIKLKYGGSK